MSCQACLAPDREKLRIKSGLGRRMPLSLTFSWPSAAGGLRLVSVSRSRRILINLLAPRSSMLLVAAVLTAVVPLHWHLHSRVLHGVLNPVLWEVSKLLRYVLLGWLFCTLWLIGADLLRYYWWRIGRGPECFFCGGLEVERVGRKGLFTRCLCCGRTSYY